MTPRKNELAGLIHEAKIDVPRSILVAYVLYAIALLILGYYWSNSMPHAILLWLAGLAVTILWPTLVVGTCVGILVPALINLSLPAWGLIAACLLPIFVWGGAYLARAKRMALIVLLGPYAGINYISSHIRLTNERLSHKEAVMWVYANSISIFFVIPIVPLIYCFLYRSKTEGITIAGCSELEHLESADGSVEKGLLQIPVLERKRKLISE